MIEKVWNGKIPRCCYSRKRGRGNLEVFFWFICLMMLRTMWWTKSVSMWMSGQLHSTSDDAFLEARSRAPERRTRAFLTELRPGLRILNSFVKVWNVGGSFWNAANATFLFYVLILQKRCIVLIVPLSAMLHHVWCIISVCTTVCFRKSDTWSNRSTAVAATIQGTCNLQYRH